MKRRISIGFLIAVIALVIAVPVLASYYANLTVVESNSNDYTELGMQVALDVDYLASNGYISATGLDTRVTSSGTALPHMMVDDSVLFASDVEADGTLNLLFETGESALSSFPIVVGDGGYVTIADHANLELSDDFEVEFEGYVDTSLSNGVPAFPTVEATATSAESTATTSHTVTLPSGITADDLLIVAFEGYGASHTITWPPTDWTSLASNGGGTINTLSLAYKVATGSEGASMTVTTSADVYSAHNTYRVSDYTGTPEISCDAGTTSSANPNPPSLTPSWGAYPNLWIAGFGGGTGAPRTVSSYPSNYGNGIFIEGGSGVFLKYGHVGSARRVLLATTEDPGTYTLSGSTDWRAFTIAVQGVVPTSPFIEKDNSFYAFADSGTLYASIIDTDSIVTVSVAKTSSEYKVGIWADTSDLGIDIDDVNEDSTALGGASALDNANDWVVSAIPYYDSYTHTTSSTLRITYEPDSIIVGTTLPNEENPGTYDGTITFGSNPAGVTVTLGALVSDEQLLPAGAGAEFPDPQDIAGPTGDVGLTAGLPTLTTHPLYPLMSAVNSVTDIPIGILWIGSATLILAFLFVWMIMAEGMMHQMFVALAGGGWVAFCYHQGVYPFWVIFIYAALAAAIVVGERSPTVG